MPNTRVLAYTQLARTYAPTTGVGRFVNNVVLGLAASGAADVELLISRRYVGPDGQLDPRTPLGGLPRRTFPLGERAAERLWKLTGLPRADRWCRDVDWLFVPAETYVPTRVPTVLTVHDVRVLEPAGAFGYPSDAERRDWRRRFGLWLPTAVRRAAAVVTVSEFSKRRIVELLGTDPAKVTVVGNGAEPAFFAAADADPAGLPRAAAGPYVLVIGGLRVARGGGWTLDVARRLAACGSPLTIVSVGRDEPALAAEAAGVPNVRLLGMQPDEVMPGYARNAVALLFLSIYEGFGIPAVEAMAAGTPAVVANLTALPEVVGDGGIVVDPTNIEGVVATLEQLHADPGYRAGWAARGRARAAGFTWDACVRRLLGVFGR